MWLRNFAVLILFALSIPVVTIGANVVRGIFLYPESGESNSTITAFDNSSNEGGKLTYDFELEKWRFSNDGTKFSSFGSGGGGTRLNLMENPSFEEGEAGTCTSCTMEVIPSFIATPSNESALRITGVTGGGDWLVETDVPAEYSGKEGVISFWALADGNFDVGVYRSGAYQRISIDATPGVPRFVEIPFNFRDATTVGLLVLPGHDQVIDIDEVYYGLRSISQLGLPGDVAGNIFPDPGFETGVFEIDGNKVGINKPVCSIGTGTAKIFDRTTRVTPLDKKVVGLYPTADGTWNISCSWVIERVDFKNESMLAGANVRNFGTVTDAKITVLVDNEEAWSKDITGTEARHAYPIVGGSKYEIKIEGRMEGFNESEPIGWNRIEVDNLYLGTVPDGYIQSIAYENYEEIDLTGSGDFTGGKIAVGRVGSVVTVSMAPVEGGVLASSNPANSDPGLLPEWARPGRFMSSLFTFSSPTGYRRVTAKTDGSLEIEMELMSLVNTGEVTITYLAADAKERTDVIQQRKELTAKTANVFSGRAECSSSSSIYDSSYGHAASISNFSGGECTVTYSQELSDSMSEEPNVVVAPVLSLDRVVYITSVGRTGFTVRCSDCSSSFRFRWALQKADQDLNKSIQVDGHFKASQIKGLKKKCQTKTLSADVTTAGAIADWTFTGLEIGKRYSLKVHYLCGVPYSEPSPGAGFRSCVTRLRDSGGVNGILRESRAYLYELRMADITTEMNHEFVARENSVWVDLSQLTGAGVGARLYGSTLTSAATLCELPPDTIEFTTEW